jgi:hypothetical protein
MLARVLPNARGRLCIKIDPLGLSVQRYYRLHYYLIESQVSSTGVARLC